MPNPEKRLGPRPLGDVNKARNFSFSQCVLAANSKDPIDLLQAVLRVVFYLGILRTIGGCIHLALRPSQLYETIGMSKDPIQRFPKGAEA